MILALLEHGAPMTIGEIALRLFEAGAVRLRWGFLDEPLGVDWALPSDTRLFELLETAQETGAEVELVTGTAPGWAEPWSRARRYRVLSCLPAWEPVRVTDGQRMEWLERSEIQAARWG